MAECLFFYPPPKKKTPMSEKLFRLFSFSLMEIQSDLFLMMIAFEEWGAKCKSLFEISHHSCCVFDSVQPYRIDQNDDD